MFWFFFFERIKHSNLLLTAMSEDEKKTQNKQMFLLFNNWAKSLGAVKQTNRNVKKRKRRFGQFHSLTRELHGCEKTEQTASLWFTSASQHFLSGKKTPQTFKCFMFKCSCDTTQQQNGKLYHAAPWMYACKVRRNNIEKVQTGQGASDHSHWKAAARRPSVDLLGRVTKFCSFYIRYFEFLCFYDA